MVAIFHAGKGAHAALIPPPAPCGADGAFREGTVRKTTASEVDPKEMQKAIRLSESDRDIFEAWNVVDGIAELFGSNCEVILHSFEDWPTPSSGSPRPHHWQENRFPDNGPRPQRAEGIFCREPRYCGQLLHAQRKRKIIQINYNPDPQPEKRSHRNALRQSGHLRSLSDFLFDFAPDLAGKSTSSSIFTRRLATSSTPP